MTRYFTLISHHLPNRRNQFYRQVQLRDLELSIGWGEVNPIGSTRGRIRKNLEASYLEAATLNITNGTYSLEAFASLGPGDIARPRWCSREDAGCEHQRLAMFYFVPPRQRIHVSI